ncbi:MAG: serine/threonine-protein kinase [Acidobacteriota bacterium]
MHPERWQQIRRRFEEASERPPAQRSAYLERTCAGDEELRREIDALLAAEQAIEVLGVTAERAPTPNPAPSIEAPSTEAPATQTPSTQPLASRQIGVYRLEETIGEGGMSVVYRASRDDGEFRQQVAIKVQGRELDSRHLRQRFRSERQILARLTHPHIARLLDGGTLDDDRPYVVMEYVEGLPIDVYCDRHQLGIEERLGLFRKVCQAVQYAHQNLIVHRDLKPGNILVSGDGTPKLLDFGIAKLLDPEWMPDLSSEARAPNAISPDVIEPDVIAPTTVAWMRLMTPNYASPEQARGAAITTASDVYSLGVLLYGLLSGRAPYRLDGLPAGEVERRLQEIEPTPPSAALDGDAHLDAEPSHREGPLSAPLEAVCAARGLRPEALRRRLRGDLDTIVAKAMHQDPARRYSSAAGLGEDLRRHLIGQPVTARPDRLAYRAGKFLRRHWLAVAVAATFVAMITTFAVTTRLQSRNVAIERDQVRAERDKNAEVLDFLTAIFETSSPEHSRGETITAREILDQGARRIDRQLEQRPEIHASLLVTMGNVNYNLGRYEVAKDQLSRAVAIRRWQQAPPLAMAESLQALGRTLLDTSEPEVARPLYREALALARGVPADGAIAEVSSLWGLAAASRLLGDLEISAELFREALALDASRPASLERAGILTGLARTQLERGELDEAQALAEQAVALERGLLDPEHPRIGLSLQQLAEILLHQDELERAEAVAREALALQEKVLGPDHSDLCLTLDSLAKIVLATGDTEGAEALFRRALAIAQQAFDADDPRLAVAHNNLAEALWRGGDLAAAELSVRDGLAIYRRIWGGEHPNLVSSIFNLGMLLEKRGQPDEAMAHYRETLAIMRRTVAPDQHTLAYPLIRLANLLRERGALDQAEPLLREAVTVRRNVLPEGHRLIAAAAGYHGLVLSGLQRFPEAEVLLLEAFNVYQGSTATNRLETWRQGLEELYHAWGRPQQAARFAVEPIATETTTK